MAASRNSSFAPFGPRNRNRPNPRMADKFAWSTARSLCLVVALVARSKVMAHRVKMLKTVELEPEAEEYLGEIDDWDFDIDLTT